MTVPLAVGDVVLLATDGLSEARDAGGDAAGRGAHRGPASPTARATRRPSATGSLDAANAHSGGVQDDLAIVALRVVKDDENSLALPFSPLGQSAS